MRVDVSGLCHRFVATILVKNDLGILAAWAIAVGALVIAVSLIFGSETSSGALYPRAPFSRRADRLWFSLTISGTVLTFLGSLLLGIAHIAQVPVLVWIVIVGYFIFHLTASWKLCQLYKAKNHKRYHLRCLVLPYAKFDEHESRISVSP